jgi:hypothetical protein
VIEGVRGGAIEGGCGDAIEGGRGGAIEGVRSGAIEGGCDDAIEGGCGGAIEGAAGGASERVPGLIARPPRRLRLAGWLGLAMLVCAPAQAQRDLGWDVRVAERVDVAVGGSAPLTIAIAVDRGLAVSKEAAVIVDLEPDAGIAVKKRRLGRGDAVDPEADAPRFAVPVRGESAGEHGLRLRIRFWLCSARICRPIDVRRTAIVAVAPETPGSDAGLDAAPGAGSGRTGTPRRP